MLPRFKYQINHYLSLQPGHIAVDDVRKLLEARYGIAQEVFNNDRFIAQEDEREIPKERLEIYARVLNVSLEQLTLASEPELVYYIAPKQNR
ncbi:MAG: hypothetical protein U0U09_16080 [Cyclobacteriaceae bacterium]